jgi:hypothetical protein
MGPQNEPKPDNKHQSEEEQGREFSSKVQVS